MSKIPTTMKVVSIEKVRQVQVRTVAVPVILPGEILVRIEHCLLCTWEQRIYTGASSMKLPFIAGHEVSGTVAYVPESTVTSFSVGDRVTMKTLDSCGHCEACYRGQDNQCTGLARKRSYDGIGASGGLAQYIALPVQRVFPVPGCMDTAESLPEGVLGMRPAVDLVDAAFTEPLACCVHSVNRAAVEFGEDVVVVGAGIMGQLHTVLAAKRGARVMVVEPDATRREMALRSGASLVIDPLQTNAFEVIRHATGGRGAHVVFLTTTRVELAASYLDVLARQGRMIYYGSFHPDGDIAVNPNKIHYSEKVITGSYSPATGDFWTASRLIGLSLVQVRPFLEASYPLEQSGDAFEHAIRPGSMRICIDMWR